MENSNPPANTGTYREIADPKYCQYRRNEILIDTGNQEEKEIEELKKLAAQPSTGDERD
jgi:hypothetical protein